MQPVIRAGVLAVLFLVPSTAMAGSILFGGSGAGDAVTLNASALFEVNGSQLQVTLRNTGDTSGTTKDKSANTLTGVFFDLPTGYTLTPVSATVKPGAILQPAKCDLVTCGASTTNVGGEFVYRPGTWAGHDGNHAISSSGYVDAAVGSGNFNGPDLDAPGSPDGINFGIVAPQSQSQFRPASGGMSSNPLIEEQVVLLMTIAGATPLDATKISNVSFQYGTALGEPGFKGLTTTVQSVPEPSLVWLLAPAAAAGLRRRRRHS